MKDEKKYKEYNENDFLCDEYFQDWIIHPDAEKNNFWENWLKENPSKAEVIVKAKELLGGISFKEDMPAEAQINASLAKTLAAIGDREIKKPAVVRRISVMWKAAATLLIIILGAGAYFYFNQGSEKLVVKNAADTTNTGRDILPGGNRAILTLSNGSKIVLDTAGNGTISQQGNIKIVKLDNGQIAYDQSAISNGQLAIEYNTISTPRGGQYQIELADGSKVWLNAASSIRFPTSFTGKERDVELTGEGYFEVAKNTSMPFHVKVNDMQVEVLGTHFNVNAYEDEPSVKTTLLEGSVRVKEGDKKQVIKPGQQAQVGKNKNLKVVNANIEETMAWKNGRFQFDHTDIRSWLLKYFE